MNTVLSRRSVSTAPLLAIIAVAVLLTPALAWDGVDSVTGQDVEIEQGNLVRTGETIEIYDYGSGSYRDVEVESIDRYGGSVEVEVYDSQTGETRTLEMEDD